MIRLKNGTYVLAQNHSLEGYVALSRDLVLSLLGGEWPEVKGYADFGWEDVDHWRLEEGGLILPYLGGAAMDGPTLKVYPMTIVDSMAGFFKDLGSDIEGKLA